MKLKKVMTKATLISLSLVSSFILKSCCFGAKEDFLGNNIYLSEYDNRDRIIIYQTRNCAGSGVEIVPMTVIEIAHNEEWIIAKSDSKSNDSTLNYWIILNSYQDIPDAETVKKNTLGPLDSKTFNRIIKEKSIDLELKAIE